MKLHLPVAVVLVIMSTGTPQWLFLQASAVPQTARGTSRWTVPRTAWGDPDLTGRWPSTGMVGVPIERPLPFGTRDTLTDQEYAARVAQARQQTEIDHGDFDPSAAQKSTGPEFQTRVAGILTTPSPLGPPPHWYESGKPSRQASLIVDPSDGRFPALTAEGQRRAAALHEVRERPGSLADRSPYTRCISRGVIGSALPMFADSGNDIIQAPGYVVIRHEMIHEARVIPLDRRPPLSPAIRQYMGDSRGWWDGETLVVETVNLNGKTGAGPNGGGTVLSDRARITERLTRVVGDALQYRITVEDPVTWVRPWTMAFAWRLDPVHTLFEFACHEGNRALRHMLSAENAGVGP